MRKIIDDRGRLFGKVSIIDIIVLIVVIVVIAAAYTKFNVLDSPTTAANTFEVTYTVRLPAIRMTSAILMRPGDGLFSTETGTKIGEIIHVDIIEATNPEALIDGTHIMARVEDRFDVTLTVVAQCSYSNGRYYADRSFELNSNADHKLHTKYNEFETATIMEIMDSD